MNRFSVTIFLLLSSFAAAAHLGGRQACYEDDCLQTVNEKQREQSYSVTGLNNCANYMTTTILEDPVTITNIETICFTRNPTGSDFMTPSPTPRLTPAQKKRRPHLEARATTVIPTHGTIPKYATSACDDEHYYSACSCVGVEPATITRANYTVTRTVTVVTIDLTGSCSCRTPTSTSTTTFATTLSNSTISVPTTSSTLNITLSLNSSSITTTSSSISLSTKPPWLNSTSTDFTSHSRCISTCSNTTAIDSATSTVSANTTETPTLTDVTTSFTQSSTSTWTNSTTTYSATNTTSGATDSTSSTTSGTLPTSTSCGGPTVQLCNGTCSDLSIDVLNCGACNNTCTSGHTCTNGVCTRPPCDSFCLTQRGCGPINSTCICGAESGGAGVCFEGSGLCGDFDNCNITEDCELGFVCVPETCCGRGKCLNTQGCARQGSLESDLELGPVRRVGVRDNMRLGEMNLLGEYAL